MALTKTQVSQLYVSLFGRASEGAGNTYWQTQNAANADTNINRTNTATEMLNLAVVKTYFGVTDYATTANVQTVVEAIYLNTLGKTYAQDTAGVDYWVAQVAGGVSMGSMVNSLIVAINAPANRVAAADIAASNTFNNKVSVSDYTADNLSALTTTAIFTAYLTGVTDAASTVVTAKAAALADVPVVANPGTTFTLTTGSDQITGTSADDIFTAGETAAIATFGVGDILIGGLGNDTLNWTTTAAISTIPTGASITGMETVNITSGAGVTVSTALGFTGTTTVTTTGNGISTGNAATTQALTMNVTGLVAGVEAIKADGGSSVTVNSTENKVDTIAVGGTTQTAGAIIVNQTSLATLTNGDTLGAITIDGGSTQTVNIFDGHQAAASVAGITGANVYRGGASTTAITHNDITAKAGHTATALLVGVKGHTNGAVTITDSNSTSTTAAGSLATVVVSSFAAATINSGALTSLTLKGTGTSMAVTMGALTTAVVTTLNLYVDGLSTTGAVTTPTVTTLAIDSSNNKSSIASLVAVNATTVTVAGDAKLTLTAQTITAATAITVTNTAGVEFGTALATGVTFTGGAGTDTISIGSTTKAITMGAGNDTVKTSTALVGTGGTVNAGDGTDTIVMDTAQGVTAGGSNVFNSKFTNFETLQLTNALAGTVNVGAISNASKVILNLGGGNTTSAILQDIVDGATVETRAAGTGITVNITGASGGVSNILNLALVNTSATIFTVMTAANTETINLLTADAATAGSAAVIHSATLAATSATTITVSGNNGLTLTNTGNVAVTSFDASGVVKNDTIETVNINTGAVTAATTDTAANLAVTFTGANTTAGAAISIKGGAGNDSLRGLSSSVDTIDGNGGADTIYADNGGNKTAFASANVIVSGSPTGATTVAVAFMGLTSTVNVTIAGSNPTATEIATAIRLAVTSSDVLDDLLTASGSGIGVTLVSKIDGIEVVKPVITVTPTGGASTYVAGSATAGTAGVARADVIDGGAGADDMFGGGGADSMTGGTGADAFFFTKVLSNLNIHSTVQDFNFVSGGSNNDIITIGDITTVIGTTTTVQDLTANSTLALALGAAAATNIINQGLSVFTHGSDTYAFVETTGATTTHVAADFLVKLTGTPTGLAVGATIAGAGIDAV